MKLDEIIQLRRSVRKFKDQSIDKEVIGEIIESARLAPSAVNFQPWKFYICRSEEAKKIMRQITARVFNSDAYILPAGHNNVETPLRQTTRYRYSNCRDTWC